MSLYKRGSVWWMEFVVRGIRVRESTFTANKDLAIKAERARRRSIEESVNGITAIERPKRFSIASAEWIAANEARWSKSYLTIHHTSMNHLDPVFKTRLLGEITHSAISKYQSKRKREGASNRTINIEVATLRLILKRNKLWSTIEDDVHMLPENEEIGRALEPKEASQLLEACFRSNQPSLYPAIVIYCNTVSAVPNFARARWKQVNFVQEEFQVGKSKTEGGKGASSHSIGPAMEAFTAWKARWPKAKPVDYIFPSEKLAFKGKGSAKQGVMTPLKLDLSKPLGSWKRAWNTAKRRACVECRLHDLRHHFLTNLSETQTSDSTILAIAGHLNRKMLERYSHIRSKAKRAAVEAMETTSHVA